MNKLIILLVVGVWTGLVLGLSFIEAPLKFQAPGITTNLGVGIGRLVFGALNKIEIGFVLVLVLAHLDLIKKMTTSQIVYLAIPLVIVGVQSFWLLPVLDRRAELRLAGAAVPSSYDHLYFVIMEVIKLVILVLLFVKTYKSLSPIHINP